MYHWYEHRANNSKQANKDFISHPSGWLSFFRLPSAVCRLPSAVCRLLSAVGCRLSAVGCPYYTIHPFDSTVQSD